MANSRMSRTLPSSLKRTPLGVGGGDKRAASKGEGGSNFLGGLQLNLGLSHLISGGMNLLGHLRKKTPSSSAGTPSSASVALSSPSTSSLNSDVFYEAYEHFEMSSFPSIPEAEGQTGEGHCFQVLGTFNPTWCDLCGDLIWGLYDTGASKCIHCSYTCHVKCQKKINLNCARLQPSEIPRSAEAEAAEMDSMAAQPSGQVPGLTPQGDTTPMSAGFDEDEETLANLSTMKSELMEATPSSSLDFGPGSLNSSGPSSRPPLAEADQVDDDDFKTLRDVDQIQFDHDEGEALLKDLSQRRRSSCDSNTSMDLVSVNYEFDLEELFGPNLGVILGEYNAISPSGQETVYDECDKTCQGFIRVQLNLQRPINVISGTRPPSVYNIMKDDTLDDRTLTSFYLPPDTMKALHVNNETTTRDVIRAILAKFRVADNPYKYALYEKTVKGASQERSDKSTLGRVRMRKMRDCERPLVLALQWCKDKRSEEKCFVLQENDPGEIIWESFSVPELKNFLIILDREEAWYKKRIHDKFEFIRSQMQDLADAKRADQS
ncbi:hypothetical protein TCAL_00976 [Tigriopus californicus]|uniref:Phorbol-ester/DAG-type domain-containing protein n=1 Tax=Tigriopus californicus TaxID=6832 RepID=A0A553P7S4_TIGCA|nr:ras association domain-containing protein 1 homolog [Tigriopus californicus]TRY73746.1 hypothetical protein TCAL_00976 [Tigriopus californicus]|eukprot:TCALIF_00976-PA protein Name:"Similar to RASSF5 Ras association domain-containing protein 5 (Homo sapiens)" AED:0.00 eAED:0.00 QI:428/1/0.5/1/0/0/2/0/546